jgi:type IV secretory pathway TrbD component
MQHGTGLARAEVMLFAFGVLAFAFLMLVFGEPLAGALYLPVVGGWIVAGFTFIWWFNRYLAHADERKIARLDVHRRRRARR